MKQQHSFFHYMKYFGWLTQLGISLVCPPVLFTWFAWKIQQKWNLGIWIIVVAVAFGILTAVCSFVSFAKDMLRDVKNEEEEEHET